MDTTDYWEDEGILNYFISFPETSLKALSHLTNKKVKYIKKLLENNEEAREILVHHKTVNVLTQQQQKDSIL